MKGHLKAPEGVFIIAILATLLLGPWLYAAEETLPKPEEIIAKNIEAMGGKEALNKIKNRKFVRREKNEKNEQIARTHYQERPDIDFSIVDSETLGETKSGSDGKIVWEITPLYGARLFEGDHLSFSLINSRFDGPDGPDVPYKSMKTEGIEQINGKPCYKVVKTLENGKERTVYYDKESFMIVKIISNVVSPQGNIRLETYNEEYQKINNILFPYKQSIFFRGQKVGEYTYDKIELNIDMPEGIFDIPEEVKTIMNKK